MHCENTRTIAAPRAYQKIKEQLKNETEYSLKNAAKFYALNRSSFSGATLSGGWSKRASYGRFTDSSIDRVKLFRGRNLYVCAQDFKKSIEAHPKAFWKFRKYTQNI
jgi:site-specific DNA-adenine methylase